MIVVQLPYPNLILWPNGRTKSTRWKNSEFQKHKNWAFMATKAAMGRDSYIPTGERIPIRLTVSCKPSGPEPDKGNCIAACKAFEDGIAAALCVNDKLFDWQPVHFSGRQSNFTIEVGA
jgi:crossover junction endodeoxyribonuclease RusA